MNKPPMKNISLRTFLSLLTPAPCVGDRFTFLFDTYAVHSLNGEGGCVVRYDNDFDKARLLAMLEAHGHPAPKLGLEKLPPEHNFYAPHELR